MSDHHTANSEDEEHLSEEEEIANGNIEFPSENHDTLSGSHPVNSNESADAPFNQLTPDTVLDAVESLALLSDARIFPLNSYENRVYQVGIDEGTPIIAKFYRPNRWTDEQIREEHHFSLELANAEIPVVPPMVLNGETLFYFGPYRFSLYERRGGHAPELDNLDNLYTLGQALGQMHSVGSRATFAHRDALSITRFGHDSRALLIDNHFVPTSTREAYATITAHLLEKIEATFQKIEYTSIRLHGDCHPGNILWRNEKPNFVDLDDAVMGPPIQDLWMLLSGDRLQKTEQIITIIEGYELFCEFDPAQIQLIESLRTLRLIHYAAWLAKRWSDPAFPIHFPWFNTERYWGEHILELREQMSALDEPALKLTPY